MQEVVVTSDSEPLAGEDVKVVEDVVPSSEDTVIGQTAEEPIMTLTEIEYTPLAGPSEDATTADVDMPTEYREAIAPEEDTPAISALTAENVEEFSAAIPGRSTNIFIYIKLLKIQLLKESIPLLWRNMSLLLKLHQSHLHLRFLLWTEKKHLFSSRMPPKVISLFFTFSNLALISFLSLANTCYKDGN